MGIHEHQTFASVQHDEAKQMRAEADHEIAQKEVVLVQCKAGVRDVMNEQYEQLTNLEAQQFAKRAECEEAKAKKKIVKNEAERAMTLLQSTFEKSKAAWKAKTDDAQSTLDSLQASVPKIKADSRARLANSHQAYELQKAVNDGQEDVIKQQLLELQTEQTSANGQQEAFKNKYKKQMQVSQQVGEAAKLITSKLTNIKREVEESWEVAVHEQDSTIERLTDALEKERRISDKLEQACNQPGPPRRSRFDVAEGEPERE